jgi:5-methylcytosine-specific restriction endonuclease McrA
MLPDLPARTDGREPNFVWGRPNHRETDTSMTLVSRNFSPPKRENGVCDVTVCSSCGASFAAPGGVGRPRTRCAGCRSRHAKLDGSVWRRLRLRVLAEEPVCAVPGCGWPSVEVDHVIPLSKGGAPLDRDNLQGMCKRHNGSKGASVAARRLCSCGGPTCPGRWHL